MGPDTVLALVKISLRISCGIFHPQGIARIWLVCKMTALDIIELRESICKKNLRRNWPTWVGGLSKNVV